MTPGDPARPVSGAVDPFAERPNPVPLAAVAGLVVRGCLVPGPGSPLLRPPGEGARPSRARRETAIADLISRGLLPELPAGAAGRRRLLAAEPLGRALSVLERPQARLRIGVGSPGGRSQVVQLYTAAGWVAAGFVAEEEIWVGDAFPLASLIAYLLQELASEPPDGDLDALALWPMLFQLTTALWPRRGKRPDEAVSTGEVAALLADDPACGDRARGLLREMAAAGLVEREETGVVLSPPYRSWLEPVWSGHVFEIERTSPQPRRSGGASQGPREGGGRLLFAGPPGHRVLCEDAASRTLLAAAPAARPPLAEPPDERLMIFSRPSRRELIALVGGLLGPIASPPPAA
jgi:hypothetical protein